MGDKVRFHPCCSWGATAGFGEELGREVEGAVVQVNEEHRWYRAAYETPQGTAHEAFKF